MNDYNFSAIATAITADRQERLLAVSATQCLLQQGASQQPATGLGVQILHSSGSALIRLGQWLKTHDDEKPMAYA